MERNNVAIEYFDILPDQTFSKFHRRSRTISQHFKCRSLKLRFRIYRCPSTDNVAVGWTINHLFHKTFLFSIICKYWNGTARSWKTRPVSSAWMTHGCWCAGHARNQGSRICTDPVLPAYSGFNTREVIVKPVSVIGKFITIITACNQW